MSTTFMPASIESLSRAQDTRARVAASTERAVEMGIIPALELVVYGMPAPKGSQKYVGHSKAGRPLLVDDCLREKPWRESVKWAFISLGGIANYHVAGPVRLQLVFTLPKPQGAPKKRVTLPMRKPDLDKLVRSTKDALSQVSAFEDDARVVELTAAKRYPGEGVDALERPGCVIRLWRLT